MQLRERTWQGVWISDPDYRIKSPASPIPMVFRRRFSADRPIALLRVFATAMGIFDVLMDGIRVSENYFNPGFTDYDSHLQYIVCDVKDVSAGEHTLMAVVAGGWAVGRTTHVDNTNKSKSKVSADRQALLCDLEVTYADGHIETIGTDGQYEVTEQSPWRFADFYDGEIYDARIDFDGIAWKPAAPEKLRVHPKLCERYGLPVVAHEILKPVAWIQTPSGEWIADFGQNLAGVVSFEVTGIAGQTVVIRHAEALENGQLYTRNLRSAKQTLIYICRNGKQAYSARFTYMGFRYIGVSGAGPDDLKMKALAVYSDLKPIGTFRCADENLNRLQCNLVWSGKSNFVDIPTDCPQRDERQGWTGDIALFAPTACFNFDMGPFLKKWLLDLKTEQKALGTIPFVIPSRKGVTPVITTSCWGDACISVPWALYMSNGDEDVLRMMYPTMKRYLGDVRRWAALSLPIYGSPYILKLPFQFGDWCAPNGGVQDWLKRGPWVGTAYFYRSCRLMSQIASILGERRDSCKYSVLSEKVEAAFFRVFTDGTGRMKREFQTAYVLPLYFGMGTGQQRAVMAERLWFLIKENGIHLDTGFTSTPYLLFALADNGYKDEAYRLLLQDTDPSWFYQVRHGATTMWENWDSIQPDGTIRESSLNHYAYGAVGDFFYRRICGLEMIEPGYRRFTVKPIPGGDLGWAACEHICPYGRIAVRWERKNGTFQLSLTVPEGTECELTMPDGTQKTIGGGSYDFTCLEG